MKKICVICGKEYEPHFTKEKTQKTCSKECREVLTNKYNLEYRRRDYVRKRHIAYMRKYNGNPKCVICGKPIERNYSTGHTARTRMHEECVYQDIINTLKSGQKLNTAQYQRISSRGYSVKDFIEEFMI